MVSKVNERPLIALHGFLGRPNDFQFFYGENFKSLDYFRTLELGPHVAWQDWADQFWQQKDLPEKFNLMGYSLGGRLAMNAFARQPDRIEKLILISAGVWPLSFAEGEARLRTDVAWAEKFEKLLWESVLREWNAQAVFVGSQQEPSRVESDYDRVQLVQALTNWSPARMPDYSPVLRDHSSRIHLICGEHDMKYRQKFQDFFDKKMCRDVRIIPNSGHRVIFDQPQSVVKAVQAILGSS